uniref:Uncharacterized protein n=1 Tax=Timema cristinae TaxID=61476 RepID=A0A7R9DCA8_TIMCR|nr:unnamed protein product [Timema cristinae]
MAETKECSGLDDPRYRITMGQQMAASCTGALITSFIGLTDSMNEYSANKHYGELTEPQPRFGVACLDD